MERMSDDDAGAVAAAAATGEGFRARLGALRTELRRRNLDGFVVPKADEHQGECVAARAERLAWLTGFTGSAGSAVVLAAAAAVFVDGRYTLQVRAEVAAELYQHRHVTEDPPESWLARHLAKGARLGYDPWLHTRAQVKRLERACRRADAEAVAVASNPVDAVWTDQPPPPLTPAFPHPVKHAGEAAAAKRKRLARGLAEDGLAAAVLTAPDSICWLLNLRGGDVPFTPLALAFAVLHADASVELFMDRRKAAPGLARHLGSKVALQGPDGFGAALDRLGRKKARVRLDVGTAATWIADRLEKAGAAVDAGADLCQRPKACKNDVELAGMRAAHRRDGLALTRFLAWLAATAPARGLTESTACDRLEALRRRTRAYAGPSFPTIAGAGPNGAIVHYRVTPATDRPLRKRELFLVDSGGQYPDGTTDVTRTVAIGNPTREMRDRFTRVLKGHIAIARARFPVGTTGGQLDAFARGALWDAGLDYDHGTGHGVGSFLAVHEGPQRISKAAGGARLEPGMVVSNEPGYYKTGAYGIRIENLVVVRPLPAPRGAERELLGFETLTLAPIDRTLVEVKRLTAEERHWLDAYHARVMRELGPRLDAGDRRWLRAATRPLER